MPVRCFEFRAEEDSFFRKDRECVVIKRGLGERDVYVYDRVGKGGGVRSGVSDI